MLNETKLDKDMGGKMEKYAYTPESLAERWHCTPQHIRNLTKKGQLPHFKLGRLIRIKADEVEKFECGERSYIGETGTPLQMRVEKPKGLPYAPQTGTRPTGSSTGF